jgi:CheY-like chemotaxis protein
MREATINAELHAVEDGEEALAHLRRGAERPDLVLLDLNLPRRDGREVLEAIKSDPDLKSIPVIVLSTSAAPRDIADCYALHANSYLVKPLGLDEFGALVRALDAFWLQTAELPGGRRR